MLYNEIAIDIETSGLDWKTDSIHGIAIAWSEDNAEYYQLEVVKPEILAILSEPRTTKILHNANFDLKFFHRASIEVEGPIEDTLLLAQLVNENQSLKLKDLAYKYLGPDSIKHARAIWKWLDQNKLKKEDLYKAPIDLLAAYACEDVNNTLKLKYVFLDRLQKTGKIIKERDWCKRDPIDYYEKESIPTDQVLRKMELRGVKIDQILLGQKKEEIEAEQKEILQRLSKTFEVEIKEILDERFRIVVDNLKTPRGKANAKYPEFEWTSVKQIGDLYYNTLGLSKLFPNSKTAKGQWKCDDAFFKTVLKSPGIDQRILDSCKDIILHSKTKKRLGTDIGGLEKRLWNGRIHSSFKQTSPQDTNEAKGTLTGRLSSADPNLQNQEEFAKALFVPDSDEYCFLKADYSQVELRIAAHLSNDPEMVNSILAGEDLHTKTMGFLKAPKRAIGKTCNFLLIFGGSPWKLMDELGKPPPKYAGIKISIEEAELYHQRFFELYKVYAEYLRQQKLFMEKNLMVVSAFGRLRRLPELAIKPLLDWRTRTIRDKSLNRQLQDEIDRMNPKDRFFIRDGKKQPLTPFIKAQKKVSHAINQGLNFPIQSVAASIMKRAMVKLDSLGYDNVNQVHDEIILQIKKVDIEKHQQIIKNVLETIVKLRVPLEVEMKVSNSFSGV